MYNLKKIQSKYHIIRGYVPPLPFSDSAFDLITAIGITEHVPDEKLFAKEIWRVLKPNGVYICTIPVEIGIAGLIRHIVKNIVYPGRKDCKSIFDYSIGELRGNCSRKMHKTAHKYYNYKYLLNDLKDTFDSVAIHTWPEYFPKFLAPIYIARCTKRNSSLQIHGDEMEWCDMKRCTKYILPETFPGIEFDENGICNCCLNYGLARKERK